MNLFNEWKVNTQLNNAGSESSIFDVRRLEWAGLLQSIQNRAGTDKKIRICKVSASNNVIILGTKDCSIFRWNLNGTVKDIDEVDISRRPEDTLDKIFIDPTGFHCIITLRNGENFYIHSKSQRPKKISRLQGHIESAAFNRHGGSEAVTAPFLLGTNLGFIYEMVLDSNGKEKVFRAVYQMDIALPITSLYIETIRGSTARIDDSKSTLSSAASSSTELFVLCATSSPTRLYHFRGGPTFESLFASYANRGESSFTELPGDISRAELHCICSDTTNKSPTFALITELGLYHGTATFPYSSSPVSDDVIIEAQLMPYVGACAIEEIEFSGSSSKERNALNLSRPFSIAITDYHFLVLNHTTLQAICRINGELIMEKDLYSLGFTSSSNSNTASNQPMSSLPIGLVRDGTTNNIWLATENSIFQVNESVKSYIVYRILK
jgi:hypothetical protein